MGDEHYDRLKAEALSKGIRRYSVRLLIPYNSRSSVDFLALQKPNSEFEMPGGRVRNGETLEEAAVREADEETGLMVRVDEFLRHRDLSAKDGATVREFFFRVKPYSRGNGIKTAVNIDSREHQGYEWISLDYLGDYKMNSLEKRVARSAFDYGRTG